MIQVLIILSTTLVFSMIITPLMRRIALHIGIISIPRSRDSHGIPVPLLGGAAIYLAFFIAFLSQFQRTYVVEGLGIMIGATVMSLFGLVDDRWGMSARIKLGGQLFAAIILIISGIQVSIFSAPYGWLNWVITVIWVVGITNAMNFLDNMDGLSAGGATIASSFLLLFAIMNVPRQVLVAIMAAALMGACIGFLRYNFSSHSRIFMGDTGSLLIGFILASLAIKLRFPSNIPLVTWMVPVCVLGVPIFDMTLVVISRLRRRVNPFTTAGKDHISHRLVAMGMTPREAVLTCYLFMGACGMVATYLTQARPDEAYAVGGVFFLAFISGIIWLERTCPGGVARKEKQVQSS